MNENRFAQGVSRRTVLALAAAAPSGALGGGEPRPGAAMSTDLGPLRATDPPIPIHQQGADMDVTITHLNPEGMYANPAYSQAVVVGGPAKTIYVGGQNGVDADGKVVNGGLVAQTEQLYRNLETVLAAAGATLHDIVKWTIYVVEGADIAAGVEVFRRTWGQTAPPPVITVVTVAGFANPEFLIEIDAIAVTRA